MWGVLTADDLIAVHGSVYAIDMRGSSRGGRCRAVRHDGTGDMLTAPTIDELGGMIGDERDSDPQDPFTWAADPDGSQP